jgi:uncharacterized protein
MRAILSSGRMASEDADAKLEAGKASPRVLATMGSEERTPFEFPASCKIDLATSKIIMQRARMVENERDLVAQLKAIRGNPGYVVENYVVVAKLRHGQAGLLALARGIQFAFGDADP